MELHCCVCTFSGIRLANLMVCILPDGCREFSSESGNGATRFILIAPVHLHILFKMQNQTKTQWDHFVIFHQTQSLKAYPFSEVLMICMSLQRLALNTWRDVFEETQVLICLRFQKNRKKLLHSTQITIHWSLVFFPEAVLLPLVET